MRNDASISSGSAGFCSRQRPIRGKSQRFAKDGSTVTRKRKDSPPAAAAAACTPSSRSDKRVSHAAQQRVARGIEYDPTPAALE